MHSETGIWAGKQATPLSQAEIDIGLLEDRLVDLLNRHGEPAVVGPQFAAVLGEGDGGERLGRLITACGCEDRIGAFIHHGCRAPSSNGRRKQNAQSPN